MNIDNNRLSSFQKLYNMTFTAFKKEVNISISIKSTHKKVILDSFNVDIKSSYEYFLNPFNFVFCSNNLLTFSMQRK